ncbi:MAG TPA: hypothetical protein VEU08_16505 [Vicinamibacterales bacterium]|nr:hypothetical protein [Vicinamibacterales bacterium]
MALLIQNQAAFVQSQTAFLARMTETDARFARIEQDLDQIKALLVRHEQILNELPEAIRQKVGFKSR